MINMERKKQLSAIFTVALLLLVPIRKTNAYSWSSWWYYSGEDSTNWYNQYGDTTSFFGDTLSTEIFDTSSLCPSEYTFYHGSCYRLEASYTSWHAANASCAADARWAGRASRLADVRNRAENWFVRGLAQEAGGAYGAAWLGLSTWREAATWAWEPDGRPIGAFTPWYDRAYEDEQAGEDTYCAAMWGGARWRGLDCDHEHYYVCEIESNVTQVNVTTSTSCDGNCDGFTGSCYCDEGCVHYGDCCDDACSECGACSAPDKSAAPVCALTAARYRYDEDAGAYSGAVYHFRSNGTEWDWANQEVFPAPDGYSWGYFGRDVEFIHENAFIVGQYYKYQSDAGYGAGAAYVYEYNGTDYKLDAELYPSSGLSSYDYFGYAVAGLGYDDEGSLRALVSAPGDDTMGYNSGAVYVFLSNGTHWNEEDKLTLSSSQSYAYLGYWERLAAISSTSFVVGTRYDYGAYIFTYSSTDGWYLDQSITEPDTSVNTYYFGDRVVALSTESIAIGDYYSNEYGYYGGGYVAIFTNSGDSWEEETILYDPDQQAYAYFGYWIGRAGTSTVAISAPYYDVGSLNSVGAVYVFEQSGSSGGYFGAGWDMAQKLLPSSIESYFYLGYGGVVGIDDDTIFSSTSSGRMSVFQKERTSGNWTQQEEIYGYRIVEGSYPYTGYGHNPDLIHCNSTSTTICSASAASTLNITVSHSDATSLCWAVIPEVNSSNQYPSYSAAFSKLKSSCIFGDEATFCSNLPDYYCYGASESSSDSTVSTQCNVSGNFSYSLIYYSSKSDGEVSVVLENAVYKVEPTAVGGAFGARAFDVEAFWDHPCDEAADEDGIVWFDLPLIPQDSGEAFHVALRPNVQNLNASRKISCTWMIEPTVYGGRTNNVSDSERYDALWADISWPGMYTSADILLTLGNVTLTEQADGNLTVNYGPCNYWSGFGKGAGTAECPDAASPVKYNGGQMMIQMDIDTTGLELSPTAKASMESTLSLKLEIYGSYCTDNSCNNHGTCTYGVCICDSEWKGDTCDVNLPADWICDADQYNSNDGCDCSCEAYDPDCDLPSQYQTCNTSVAKYDDWEMGIVGEEYCTYCYLPEYWYVHTDYPSGAKGDTCPSGGRSCSTSSGEYCDTQTGICIEADSSTSAGVYFKMCSEDDDCPSGYMTCNEGYCTDESDSSYSSTGQPFPITEDAGSCIMPFKYTAWLIGEGTCVCDGEFGFDYDSSLSTAKDEIKYLYGQNVTTLTDSCVYSSPDRMIIKYEGSVSADCVLTQFTFVSPTLLDGFAVYLDGAPVADAVSGDPVKGSAAAANSSLFCLGTAADYEVRATNNASVAVAWGEHAQTARQGAATANFSICSSLELGLTLWPDGVNFNDSAMYFLKDLDGNVATDLWGNLMSGYAPRSCEEYTYTKTFCVEYGTAFNLTIAANNMESNRGYFYQIVYQDKGDSMTAAKGVIKPMSQQTIKQTPYSSNSAGVEMCAAIGMKYESYVGPTYSGLVSMFVLANGEWVSMENHAKEAGSDSYIYTGSAMTTSGTHNEYLVYTAPYAGSDKSGEVTIWSYQDAVGEIKSVLDRGSSAQYYEGCGFTIDTLSSDAIVEGCIYHDYTSSMYSSGLAVVFRENSSTGEWSEEANMVPTDIGSYDYCYEISAVSSTKFALGCYQYDLDTTSGSDYNIGRAVIFSKESGSWTQVASMPYASDNGNDYDYCGSAGSLAGIASEWLIVGCYGWDYNTAGSWDARAGRVYIYQDASGDDSWTLADSFSGQDYYDYFGSKVEAIGDDRFAVSAIYEDSDSDGWAASNMGSVSIYVVSGSSWTKEAEMYPTDFFDSSDLYYAYFGYSMHSLGSRLLIGAEYHDYLDSHGYAYVYTVDKDSGSWSGEATFRYNGTEFGTGYWYNQLSSVALFNCSANINFDPSCYADILETSDASADKLKSWSFTAGNIECEDIVLSVMMDWTWSSGSFGSEASFTVTNSKTGKSIDNDGISMSGSLGSNLAATWEFCIDDGAYKISLKDSSGDGWSDGIIILGYSYNSQHFGLGTYTLDSGKSTTLSFDIYPEDGYFLHVTLEWPEDGSSYPSEASYTIYYSDNTKTDLDGVKMVGSGTAGSSTSTFRVDGAMSLMLVLEDSMGDGWDDDGSYILQFSYSEDGQRFVISEGTLDNGYEHSIPFYVDSATAVISHDVHFIPSAEGWSISNITTIDEFHGCSCGVCDTDGFNLTLARALAQDFLGLSSTEQNWPYSSCNLLTSSEAQVSFNFVEQGSQVLVKYVPSGSSWQVDNYTLDNRDFQCYETAIYDDCFEGKGSALCYVDEDLTKQRSCSMNDFYTCSSRFNTYHTTLDGLFSGGILSGDMACSIPVQPNIPSPLKAYAVVDVYFELFIEAATDYGVTIICFDGSEAPATVLKNTTTEYTSDENPSTTTFSYQVSPSSLAFRTNLLTNFPELYPNKSRGSVAGFSGYWTTTFNVSVDQMKPADECTGADYCFDSSEAFLYFNEKAVNSPSTSYLVQKEGADSIWINFVEFDIGEGENLTVYDGNSDSSPILAVLGPDWFDADSGNSMYLEKDIGAYMVIEIDEYPKTVMGWFMTDDVEGMVVLLSDEQLTLGINPLGNPFASYTYIHDEGNQTTHNWFADATVELGQGWVHLAFLRYDEAEFYGFMVNGEAVSSCKGPAMSSTSEVECPAIQVDDDAASLFQDTTANGYLVLGTSATLLGNSANSSADLYVDHLQLFSERLDHAEVEGSAINGSFHCDSGDHHLQRCFNFDEDFTGSAGELAQDGSVYALGAYVYGGGNAEGASGNSALETTTLAASGDALFFAFSGATENTLSTFLAAYMAVNCNCENGGKCIQGVCVCSPGWGGQNCTTDIVSQACSGSATVIQGAEVLYNKGNLTIIEPNFPYWAYTLYPSIEFNTSLPEDLYCSWVVSGDYREITIGWKDLIECGAEYVQFTVYDGLRRDNASVLTAFEGFSDLDSTYVSGSSGQVEIVFKSPKDFHCKSDSFPKLALSYKAPKVWFVAPNNGFFYDGSTYGYDTAPYFSLQEALDHASSGDTIILYPGRYEGDGLVGITISKAVTIKSVSGFTYTIFDGEGTTNIFTVKASGNVTFEGFTFKGGDDTAGGGIMISQGYVTFTDCLFEENEARKGAAIYIKEPGSLVVVDSAFHKNAATEDGSSIFVDSAHVLISGCIFEGNSGSSIAVDSSYASSPYLVGENISFINNTAPLGAGIHTLTTCEIHLDNASFISNTAVSSAANGGGGLYFSSGTVAILSGISASGNVALHGSLVYSAAQSTISIENFTMNENNGSVIYATGADVSLGSGQFFYNIALISGVGIELWFSTLVLENVYFHDNSLFPCLYGSGSQVTVLSSQFSGNSATEGSAIYITDDSTLDIAHSVFTNHTSVWGGAIFIQDCDSDHQDVNVNIDNCIFMNNSAVFNANNRGSEGGCIYADSSTVLVSASTFLNNRAESGGVLFLASVSKTAYFYGSNNEFSSNVATNGGCHYIDKLSHIETSDEEYEGNSASESGGSWFISEGEVVMKNHRYTNGYASHHGGGILLSSSSTLTAQNMYFSHCEAHTGGALSIRSESDFSVLNMTVSQCEAMYGGGFSAQEESTVSLLGGILFEDNLASKDGGALYLVRLDQTTPLVYQGAFLNNEAAEIGGAIYSALCELVVLSNVTTEGNMAEAGSEICAMSSNLVLSDSVLYGSTVQTGALYLLHSDLKLINTQMQLHDASNNGGCIYAFSAVIHAYRSTCLNSSAEIGGAYYLFESTVALYQAKLLYNLASGAGGAIYVTSTDSVKMFDSEISSNYAGAGGGAVQIQESSVVVLSNSIFKDNKANEEGGGLLLEQLVSLEISNCSIIKNEVTHGTYDSLYGGAGAKVYQVDEALIMGSSFIGNSGNVDGGGLYLAYTEATLIGNTFSGNSAKNGGALYLGPDYYSDSGSSTATPTSSTLEERRGLQTASTASANSGGCYKDCAWRHWVPLSPREIALKSRSGDIWDGSIQYAASATQSSVTVTGSMFIANDASSGGGAFYYEDYEPFGMTENSFANNTAMYGDSFTAPAYRINVTHSGVTEASGSVLSTIKILLLDTYGQLVANENETDIFAGVADVDANDATVSGTTTVPFVNGIGTFNALVATKQPGETVKLEFYTTIDTLVVSNAFLDVDFRHCVKGEVKPEDSGYCKECEYGFFSWVPGEEDCHECPEGAICYGKDHVKALWGYWRFDNTTGRCEDYDGTDEDYEYWGTTFDDCELIECEWEDACEGEIQFSDVRVSEDFSIDTSSASGSSIKSTLQTYCGENLGSGYYDYTNCTLILEGGYFLKIANQTGSVTSESITLMPSSQTLLADFDTLLEYNFYLSYPEGCRNGHTGNVCDRCIEAYSATGTYGECTPCPDDMRISYAITGAGLIAVTVVGSIMIRLQMNKENSENEKLSIMMKIFTSYLQLVSLFGNIDMDWPDQVAELFDRQNTISSAGDKIFSIDCVLNREVKEDDTEVFFQKFLFYMLLPILAVSFSACFWTGVYFKKAWDFRKPWDFEAAGLSNEIEDGIIEAHEVQAVLEKLGENSEPIRVDGVIENLGLKKHPARVEDFQDSYLFSFRIVCQNNAILSTIVLLFMLHPNVAMYTFYVFTCDELATDRYYLQQDLETMCYTSEHNFWRVIGLVCMICYTFGIPAYGFKVLRSVRHNLKNKHVRLKYGFLYDGYEEKYYFWEMWVMMRKVGVIFITVFVSQTGSVLAEVTTALAFTVFAIVLHLRHQPYEDDDLDLLECFALYAAAVTLFSGVYFYNEDFANDYPFVKPLFMIIIFIANFAFVIYFVLAGYNEFKYKLLADTQQYREKVLSLRRRWRERKTLSKDQRKAIKNAEDALQQLAVLSDERVFKQDEVTVLRAEIVGLARAAGGRRELLGEALQDLADIDSQIAAFFYDDLDAESIPGHMKEAFEDELRKAGADSVDLILKNKKLKGEGVQEADDKHAEDGNGAQLSGKDAIVELYNMLNSNQQTKSKRRICSVESVAEFFSNISDNLLPSRKETDAAWGKANTLARNPDILKSGRELATTSYSARQKKIGEENSASMPASLPGSLPPGQTDQEEEQGKEKLPEQRFDQLNDYYGNSIEEEQVESKQENSMSAPQG